MKNKREELNEIIKYVKDKEGKELVAEYINKVRSSYKKDREGKFSQTTYHHDPDHFERFANAIIRLVDKIPNSRVNKIIANDINKFRNNNYYKCLIYINENDKITSPIERLESLYNLFKGIKNKDTKYINGITQGVITLPREELDYFIANYIIPLFGIIKLEKDYLVAHNIFKTWAPTKENPFNKFEEICNKLDNAMKMFYSLDDELKDTILIPEYETKNSFAYVNDLSVLLKLLVDVNNEEIEKNSEIDFSYIESLNTYDDDGKIVSAISNSEFDYYKALVLKLKNSFITSDYRTNKVTFNIKNMIYSIENFVNELEFKLIILNKYQDLKTIVNTFKPYNYFKFNGNESIVLPYLDSITEVIEKSLKEIRTKINSMSNMKDNLFNSYPRLQVFRYIFKETIVLNNNEKKFYNMINGLEYLDKKYPNEPFLNKYIIMIFKLCFDNIKFINDYKLNDLIDFEGRVKVFINNFSTYLLIGECLNKNKE